MTTAHEIGAAFGVAVLSAVALGSGAAISSGGSVASGYGDGTLAGAVLAMSLALIAVIALPAFKPIQVQHVSMH